MFSSLGQLVMLSPASPRTLAMIPPSNKALNQMVLLQLCYLHIIVVFSMLFLILIEFVFVHRKISCFYF